MNHPFTDAVDPEEQARLRLEPFWEHAGMGLEGIQYPVSTNQVLSLMTICDYNCDGDFVLGLVNAGTIPVPRVGGKFAWDALHVYMLLGQLESRRRWKLSPMHVHKMTALEKAELEARAAGESTAFADLDAFDIEALLCMMEQAEQRAVRHACLLAIRAKLRAGETL